MYIHKEYVHFRINPMTSFEDCNFSLPLELQLGCVPTCWKWGSLFNITKNSSVNLVEGNDQTTFVVKTMRKVTSKKIESARILDSFCRNCQMARAAKENVLSQGLSELRKETGRAVARYCNKQCQNSNWHKEECSTLRSSSQPATCS
jgi:hypothetical protein